MYFILLRFAAMFRVRSKIPQQNTPSCKGKITSRYQELCTHTCMHNFSNIFQKITDRNMYIYISNKRPGRLLNNLIFLQGNTLKGAFKRGRGYCKFCNEKL